MSGVSDSGVASREVLPTEQAGSGDRVALLGGWRFVLPMILCVYLVFATLHALWVPVGQTGYQNAPDEAAHVAYIRTLATGRLPDRSLASLDSTGRSYEWHQPPLYYAWAALFIPAGERGLRIASILIGLVSLVIIFRTARWLVPQDPYMALVATAFAGLLPTHIAISSTVNNDILLELCFSLVLMLLVTAEPAKLNTHRAYINRAFCVGLVLGIALLTKLTAVLLIPVIALWLLFVALNGVPPRRVLLVAGVIALIALAVSGWWFARNMSLYGELLPIRAFNNAFQGTAQARPRIERFGVMLYTQTVVIDSFKSFWAVFGNAQSSRVGIPLFLPDQIYLFPLLLTLIGMAGFVRLHFERNRLFSRVQLQSIWLSIVTLLLVGGSFALFLTRYYQTQGRYLFPALLPISLLLSLGWLALLPDRYRKIASGTILVIMILLSLLFLTSVQAASP